MLGVFLLIGAGSASWMKFLVMASRSSYNQQWPQCFLCGNDAFVHKIKHITCFMGETNGMTNNHFKFYWHRVATCQNKRRDVFTLQMCLANLFSSHITITS